MLFPAQGGWRVQVRHGAGRRTWVTIFLRDRAEAEERAEKIRAVAPALRNHPRAGAILALMGREDEEGFRDVVDTIAKEREAAETDRRALTFGQLATLWTSGKLHEQYPDHIKLKTTASDDESRLAVLCETIGDVPLRDFTLNHAEAAMAGLRGGLSTNTRRQYAQLISRVMQLATYPMRILTHSPIPRGFLPKPGKHKAFAWLYPKEDATLLACTDVAFSRRLLYGFLSREGLRLSEALGLTWADIDLQAGAITLDRNKTNRPRAWALDPGVVRALRTQKGPPGTHVFERFDSTSAAEQFRRHLLLAGIDRPELHRKSPERMPIRVHDLRATFITVALAEGKSETWVTDRTGHTSSQMLRRYQRTARMASELRLGRLMPLDVALGLDTQGGTGGGKQTENEVKEVAGLINQNADGSHARRAQARRNIVPLDGDAAVLEQALEIAKEAGDWTLVEALAGALKRNSDQGGS